MKEREVIFQNRYVKFEMEVTQHGEDEDAPVISRLIKHGPTHTEEIGMSKPMAEAVIDALIQIYYGEEANGS